MGTWSGFAFAFLALRSPLFRITSDRLTHATSPLLFSATPSAFVDFYGGHIFSDFNDVALGATMYVGLLAREIYRQANESVSGSHEKRE